MIYQAERLSKELAAKMSKEQSEQLTKSISELRQALSGKDNAAIKQNLESLQKVMQEIGTAAYQQVAQQQAASGSAPGTNPQEQENKKDVVDVDYKVVDDKKQT
jgi:hypothetical protein